MEKTGVSAIVEYDYAAKEADELTLKKGAIITNIKIQPGGWWEGTLTATGRTGMFPDNFVRVLEPDDKNPVVLRDKTATQNRRCKVIYSYRENKPDELSLAVGDVIEIFEEVEEGWWRGKLNGKVGVFPSNFVEPIESVSPTSANRRSSTGGAAVGKPHPGVIVDGATTGSLTKTNSLNKSRTSLSSSREDLDAPPHDAPSLPPKPVRELCRVLFAYAPANDDELKLGEGDIITILSKDLPDKGWWKGELRGKVGVFPDNFVVLLPPEVSPVKEPSFHPKPDRPPPASKILVGGKPSSNSRKESFGSKDSLNETGPATGSPTFGNVAAHRKSLESRSAVSTESSPAAAVTEKPPRKSLDSKTSEIRKSLESLDEKKSTPPPVLGKKPQVPIKKSPSITSVTGNLFSGLKQKVKGESKTTAGPVSQDSMDGVGGSKVKSEVADNNEKNVERLSGRTEESEFGHVERGSVLKDMRANRAKAPKRRPPTSAGSLIIESASPAGSNGMSNGNSGLFHQLSQNSEPESPKPDLLNVSHHSGNAANNNNEDEFIAKPKAREWEKHKVPWMDELKASQAKKTTTSPNVNESKSPEHSSVSSSTSTNHNHEESKFETISKSFHSGSVSSSSTTTASSSVSASGRTRLSERAATADVTSSTTNNHHINSSFDLIASSRKETSTTSSTSSSHQQHSLAAVSNDSMTKSMSALSTKIAISSDAANATTNESPAPATAPPVANARPISVNLRNRSISPTPITRNTKTIHIAGTSEANGTTSSGSTTTTAIGGAVTSDNVCTRVQDLEAKVNRMERALNAQNGLIEELKRALRDESDKVRTLQKELEKYAQCVTQV